MKSPLDKPAVTSRPVHDLIRDRWSPRAFAAKPVPAEALTALFEAARWAASSNNGQPWRWIVAASDDPSAHATAVGCFTPKNQRWTRAVPVLAFACARKTFEANGNPNLHAWYDTGAADAQLTVEASARGLHVHQAAGIERDRIRATYGVPDEYDIVCGIAIGYRGDPDSLPEELPAREREPRVRKPLAELVFGRAFGKPAKFVG